jgi:hypothetical protein
MARSIDELECFPDPQLLIWRLIGGGRVVLRAFNGGLVVTQPAVLPMTNIVFAERRQ